MADSRRTGDNGTEDSAGGQLRAEVVNQGSKSERRQPVIEDDEGQQTPVYVVGDHPFENETLSTLEGQQVQVRGRWRNGVLRVAPEDLEVIEESTPDEQADG